jgi:MoxR-like ATPase
VTSDLSLADVRRLSAAVIGQVERAVVGKREALLLVLTALLAGGHVLLEDYPGLAKTLIARSFAQVLGLGFSRIQFTPDLMPSDVTGSSIFDQRVSSLTFAPGPVFANLVLGDEINRAPPKTQASLLEAMQERQVTVDGVSHPLPAPFNVVATQNPIEYEGTYPLPEAQLDRFLIRIGVGYPTRDDEAGVLRKRLERRQEDIALDAVADAATLAAMQRAVELVHVDESLILYMVDVVRATRGREGVLVGASPRGALGLLATSRVRAVFAGRDFVAPEDVKEMAVPVLAHRLSLRPDLWVRGASAADVVAECLDSVAVPVADPAR